MNKSLKLLTLLLAALIVIAAGMTAVSAAEEVADPAAPAADDGGSQEYADTPVEPDPAAPDAYSEYSDANVDSADNVDSGEGDNSGSDDGNVDQEAPAYSEEPVDTQEPVDTDAPDTDYVDGDSGAVDSDTDTATYYYEEDPLWYGDANDYAYNYNEDDSASVGSVADSATLFDTSGSSRVDVTPNKWTDITLDEKTTKSGTGSFSAIKSNTDKNDNGQWILYLGYVLLILSALGILYFIIATISARKQNRRDIRHNSGAGSSAAYTSLDKAEIVKKPAQNRRSSGHYADGYDNYSSRRASKADTGEIYVPRRAKTK